MPSRFALKTFFIALAINTIIVFIINGHCKTVVLCGVKASKKSLRHATAAVLTESFLFCFYYTIMLDKSRNGLIIVTKQRSAE